VRSPLTAGFLATLKRISLQTGLAGWRRSADGILLCPFSLLTGNFTGNSAKSWLLARQRLHVVASVQDVRRKFPTQRIRELFQQIREFSRGIREFNLPKPKLSPDDVLGTLRRECRVILRTFNAIYVKK
jgi:hypothetical protein